jgi:hypothetical protein
MSCSQFTQFAVARSICRTDKQSHTVARILNCLPHALVLPKETKVATVQNINVNTSCEPFKMPSTQAKTDLLQSENKLTRQELNQFASEYGFKINPDLTESQRFEILHLLHRYRNCFARNLKEIRRFKNYELELTLKDKRPSCRRQYKLSHEDAFECHRQINEVSECGIIEPSQNSMYQSAIFIVRKANCQKRAVLDLRPINDKFEPFLLQLPDMHQLLNALASQKGRYHITLHQALGFHQVPLKEGVSRDVTSFCDPVTGLRYRYTCAPFGLSTSPAAMITVLMGIMSPFVSQNKAFVHMDDISFASHDWSQHLKRLETVLKILDLNTLSCLLAKTSLAFPSIKFLGFEVSKDGLKMTDDKIKLIKALKTPHDKKNLCKEYVVFGIFSNIFVPSFLSRHFTCVSFSR